MKKLICAAALVASLAPAAQARQVYSGSEAAALRCAAIMTVLPSFMYNKGMISRNQVTRFQLVATAILTRYVGGTERQKLAALKTMAQRRDGAAHIKDFQDNAKTCLRQFPLQ